MFLVFFCAFSLPLRYPEKHVEKPDEFCDTLRPHSVWQVHRLQMQRARLVGYSAAQQSQRPHISRLDIQVELGNDLRAEVRAEAGCGGSCEIKSQRSQHDADCKALQMTKV